MRLSVSLLYFSVLLISAYSESRGEHSHEEFHRISHRHKSDGKHHHPLRRGSYRSGNEVCSWVCTPSPSNSSNTNVEIFYNGNSSLIAISSKSGDVALVIDYANNAFAFFNGKTGVVIVVDIKTRKIYLIKRNSKTESIIWLNSKPFATYFKNLQNLKGVIQIAQQQEEKCEFSKITPIILSELKYIFGILGTSGSELDSLKIFVAFTTQLNGQLKILYKGSGSFSIQNSGYWFVCVNLALGNLMNGAEGLQTAHLDLNLKAIFNVASGIEALVNFLDQVGRHLDLARSFASILLSPERLLQLLREISAGSHNGLDGMITVIVNIIEFMNGRGSVTAIIISIYNRNASSTGASSNLTTVCNQALNIAESQNRQFRNAEGLKWIVQFLHLINNNNYVFRNVNISDIIKLLISGNPSDLTPTIIKILSLFLPSRGIPELCRFWLTVFNSTNNVEFLRRILPGVNFQNLTNTGNGTLLARILRNANITNLLSQNSNITSALSGVPIIGDLVSRLSAGLGRGNDINRYLNASNIIGDFRHFLETGGNFSQIILNPSGVISNLYHGFLETPSDIQHVFGPVLGQGNSNGSAPAQNTSAVGSGSGGSLLNILGSGNSNGSAPGQNTSAAGSGSGGSWLNILGSGNSNGSALGQIVPAAGSGSGGPFLNVVSRGEAALNLRVKAKKDSKKARKHEEHKAQHL